MFKVILVILLLLGNYSAAAKENITNKIPEIKMVTAKSWIVADMDGNIIESQNHNEVRSIASITKLMTVIIVLDSGADLQEHVGALHGRKMSREKLIELAMVYSDNNAAKMLCDTYPYGYDACIRDMNRSAANLGMHNTVFTEPTGLFNTNISTAVDLLKLVKHAANYPKIVQVSNQPTVVLEPIKTKKKNSLEVVLRNTNSIIASGINFLVSKTGYIRASGGCIVFTMHAENGWRTVILLGSKSLQSRIPEAKYLANKY